MLILKAICISSDNEIMILIWRDEENVHSKLFAPLGFIGYIYAFISSSQTPPG